MSAFLVASWHRYITLFIPHLHPFSRPSLLSSPIFWSPFLFLCRPMFAVHEVYIYCGELAHLCNTSWFLIFHTCPFHSLTPSIFWPLFPVRVICFSTSYSYLVLYSLFFILGFSCRRNNVVLKVAYSIYLINIMDLKCISFPTNNSNVSV